ncbi:MAG: substrate-binding domain-containing protein, partial [Proteiniphilum sp.]|nr:substrate-binding domain-containing protein [Proteiniphilum sp.]
MKKVLMVSLILILAFGSVFAQGTKEAKSGYTFGYTCMTMNNPFFIILEKSIRDKVEANGDKLITMDPAMDVAKQINQIEDLITQGIDAIF